MRAIDSISYDVMFIKNTRFWRTPDKPKIYKESTLYAAIRDILNDAGFHVVRQVPAKDGHLTSAPYYIREYRNKWCLFDELHQVRFLHEAFNAGKEITLRYVE